MHVHNTERSNIVTTLSVVSERGSNNRVSGDGRSRAAMPGGGELNYVHEAEIWRQQLKTEVEGAAVWNDNWGFLTGREQGVPRGFSENVAKYSYGPGKWSVKSVRVPDNSDEGIAAATSEQNARKLMSTLTWQTAPDGPTKPCESKVREPLPLPLPRPQQAARRRVSARVAERVWTGLGCGGDGSHSLSIAPSRRRVWDLHTARTRRGARVRVREVLCEVPRMRSAGGRAYARAGQSIGRRFRKRRREPRGGLADALA